MKKELRTGHFSSPLSNGLERRVLIVYTGDFESMDGLVNVSDEQIINLVQKHNDYLRTIDLPQMKDFPPLMLDHSTSAKDVVGRLCGALELGEFEGKKAIYGTATILGAENQEKVADGRWTHVSIGADFDIGKIYELTITPFPAAENASFLCKKKGENMTIKLSKSRFQEAQKAHLDDVKASHIRYLSEQKIMEEKHAEIMEQATPENKEELKTKFLADCDEAHRKHLEVLAAIHSLHFDKMAEDDIPEAVEKKETEEVGEEPEGKEGEESDETEKLAEKETPDEEAKETEEHEKKESPEEEKEEHKELKKSLSAFASKQSEVRLALRRNTICRKLSNLKAAAKITPAELKKIELSKLSAMNEATIDAVFQTYENRQPVIDTKLYSSTKAVSAASLHSMAVKSQLERETRANMKSLSNSQKNLAFGTDEQTEKTKPAIAEVSMRMDPDSEMELFKAMCEAYKSGEEMKACEMWKAHLASRLEANSPVLDEENEKIMMSAFGELEAQHEKLVRLTAKCIKGIKL